MLIQIIIFTTHGFINNPVLFLLAIRRRFLLLLLLMLMAILRFRSDNFAARIGYLKMHRRHPRPRRLFFRQPLPTPILVHRPNQDGRRGRAHSQTRIIAIRAPIRLAHVHTEQRARRLVALGRAAQRADFARLEAMG